MRYTENATYATQEVLRMIIDAQEVDYVWLIWDHVSKDRFEYCLDDLKIIMWAVRARLKQLKNKS